MFSTLHRRLRQTDGASAVEYALLLVSIAAILVAIVFVAGGRVKSQFSKTNSCFSVQGQATACGGVAAAENENENEGGGGNQPNCNLRPRPAGCPRGGGG